MVIEKNECQQHMVFPDGHSSTYHAQCNSTSVITVERTDAFFTIKPLYIVESTNAIHGYSTLYSPFHSGKNRSELTTETIEFDWFFCGMCVFRALETFTRCC